MDLEKTPQQQQPTGTPAGYPPPGPGQHPDQPRGTDGLSIASLVTGVLGLGVVAIVLGVLGLKRTKQHGTGGRGLSIAGIVLGGLGIVGWVVAVVALVGLASYSVSQETTTTSLPAPSASAPSPAPTELAGALSLQTGDCLQEGSERVETVDCAQPHTGEVVDTFDTQLGGTTFPGDEAVQGEADERCAASLQQNLDAAGRSSDDFGFGYYSPSRETWLIGDRAINCVLYPAVDGATLTGSLTAGTLA